MTKNNESPPNESTNTSSAVETPTSTGTSSPESDKTAEDQDITLEQYLDLPGIDKNNDSFNLNQTTQSDYLSYADPPIQTKSQQTNPLIAERDELKNKLLRALADSENMRKRAERDRTEARQYGATAFARDMLVVWDNLARALASVTEQQRQNAQAIIEGIELTQRDLNASFDRHGIRSINPNVGDAFDPQHHQAMFETPHPTVPSGHIALVMTQGFSMHDRLLRAAQVGVSSGAGAAAADSDIDSKNKASPSET